MPSLSENARKWNTYEWDQAGDEWSVPWGDSNQIWLGHLMPRIRRFLPAQSLLEIAPGYGRWTRYLRESTGNYQGVDVAQKAVEACRQQFPDLRFYRNDGLTLPMIDDRSISFCFSYDSLVHANSDVMSAYITELNRLLAADGVAFLHHSNLGAYRSSLEIRNRIATFIPTLLLKKRLKLIPDTHWRDPGVSAEFVKERCTQEGLYCRQELITWLETDGVLIDCFTLISRQPMNYALIRNYDFGEALALNSQRCAEHYRL
jgi:SAM-dependent methyltransferase